MLLRLGGNDPDAIVRYHSVGTNWQEVDGKRSPHVIENVREVTTKLHAIALYARYSLALNKLGVIYYIEVDTQFERAIRIKDLPLAHLMRSKTLIHLARYREAEHELQAVIKAGGEEVAMAYSFSARYTMTLIPKILLKHFRIYCDMCRYSIIVPESVPTFFSCNRVDALE